MTGDTWLRCWVSEGEAFYNSEEQAAGDKKALRRWRCEGCREGGRKRRVFQWDTLSSKHLLDLHVETSNVGLALRRSWPKMLDPKPKCLPEFQMRDLISRIAFHTK